MAMCIRPEPKLYAGHAELAELGKREAAGYGEDVDGRPTSSTRRRIASRPCTPIG